VSKTAKKKNPELWERLKEDVTRSSKGGKKGQWSARKAQLATQEYRKRGGAYEGDKSEKNSLKQWSDEDWGTKSGRKSEDSGERYLPRKARDELSDEEYRRTSDKKRRDSKKGKQFSKQPDDVARKSAKHRKGAEAGPTKAELYEKAKKQGIEGRSKMSKDELKQALAT
jgi:hypothetical protein